MKMVLAQRCVGDAIPRGEAQAGGRVAVERDGAIGLLNKNSQAGVKIRCGEGEQMLASTAGHRSGTMTSGCDNRVFGSIGSDDFFGPAATSQPCSVRPSCDFTVTSTTVCDSPASFAVSGFVLVG